jgi:hypothetical protein
MNTTPSRTDLVVAPGLVRSDQPDVAEADSQEAISILRWQTANTLVAIVSRAAVHADARSRLDASLHLLARGRLPNAVVGRIH